jgi:hypothetical protein
LNRSSNTFLRYDILLIYSSITELLAICAALKIRRGFIVIFASTGSSLMLLMVAHKLPVAIAFVKSAFHPPAFFLANYFDAPSDISVVRPIE